VALERASACRKALLSLSGRQYLEIFAPDPAQAQIVPQYASLRTLESPRLMMWAAAARVEETAARCRALARGRRITRQGS
jgi:hypothetical protein